MKTKELAGAVIYDDEGKLLVLHRHTPDLTQWELAGGKIEFGEDAEAATIREIKEELKVAIRVIGQIGEASFEHKGIVWNYTWFAAEIVEGKPVIGEPTMFDQLQYMSLAELSNRDDISPNLVNLLKVLT